MSSTQPAGGGPFRSLRSAGRGAILGWIGILGAALAVRLAFAILLSHDFVFSDTLDYDRMARELLQHHSYGLSSLRPPGYPTFMAGMYFLFGYNIVAIRCAESVIGTLSVGMIGILATSLFGRPAGFVAGLLAAFHPILAFLPSALYTENLLIFFILLGLLSAFAGLRGGGLWRWLACGACFGLALLIRPNTVAMLPGLALGFAIVLARRRRYWIVPALAVVAALVITLLPWTIRNHRVYGHWFFVCTGGARQFYMGNNPGATGDTREHPGLDPVTEAEFMKLPDLFSRDRYLYAKGWEFIREHPASAARLYGLELRNLFALYPEPMTRSLINRWSLVTQAIASVVVFAGALLSLRYWRREPTLWPLLLAVVTFALVNALVFASMRYRMVVEPCLIVMAGLGWAALLRPRPEPADASRRIA